MWRVLGSQPGQLWTGGGAETEAAPFLVQAPIVCPPRLSRCPGPGPGPHSCADALGLRAGAGEREGH